MAFTLIATDEIKAPRNLSRATTKRDADGIAVHYPSVGGEVYAIHRTWRCGFCRALAVTEHETPPSKCGKCHR